MQCRAADLKDVLNFSLGLLGQQQVTTISPAPDTKAGIKLLTYLYVCIDAVQRDFFWHELITSALITANPVDHYDGRKRYALPDDCLRPLGVRLEGAGGLPETAYTRLVAHESESHYDVEANFLITSAESVNVVYIKRSDDPTEWTSELLDCVYHSLAAKGGQYVTQDAEVVKNALQAYEIMIKPHAKRLQSKYKSTETYLPVGFTMWKANRAGGYA